MPESLSSLVDEGIIDEVVRPLMSGKEAQIYLVVADGQQYVAKIYKEAQNRTFKHRTSYTEGRKVRNSRDQRAMNKRSKHGREQDEEAWRATEVDMIYRLQAAGVRVPVPYQYMDGVLIMELVVGPEGLPAPRLGDIEFTAEEAIDIYHRLLRETVRMLCAGVVHGDLSDFNVLMGADGPVIIDFPQAIDPSKNQNARRLLLRDVDNLHRFVTRFAGAQRRKPYAEEMWKLYESNSLQPETKLLGNYRGSQKRTDTGALLEFIGEVNEDEARRRGISVPRTRRVASSVGDEALSAASGETSSLSSGMGSSSSGEAPASVIRPRRVEVIVNPGDVGGARPAGGRRRTSGGGNGQARGGQSRGGQARGAQARGEQGRNQGRGQSGGRSQSNNSNGSAGQRRSQGRSQGSNSNPPLRMAPQGIGHTPRADSIDGAESAPPKLRMLPAEGAVPGPGVAKKRRRRRRRTGGGEAAPGTSASPLNGAAQTSSQDLARSNPQPSRPVAVQTSADGAGVTVSTDGSSGEPRRRRRRRPRAPRPEEN